MTSIAFAELTLTLTFWPFAGCVSVGSGSVAVCVRLRKLCVGFDFKLSISGMSQVDAQAEAVTDSAAGQTNWQLLLLLISREEVLIASENRS